MKSNFKDRAPPNDREIRDYFRILKKDPRSRVFAPLAEALVRRGRLEEAEQICRLGLEAHPEFSDGHLAYARVLYYLFRHEEALQEVKVTLGLDKESVDAYLIAAEIFLSRSQYKAASQACMKAIDLDANNEEARRLLKRTGAEAGDLKPVEAVQMTTDTFRASAGTAPSRRLIQPETHKPVADPFRELLQSTGQDGVEKLNGAEQPFFALSSGSHPDTQEPFDVPTRKEKRKRPPGTPVPKLPDHPPPPGVAPSGTTNTGDDLLAQVPGRKDELPVGPGVAPAANQPPDEPTAPAGNRPPGIGARIERAPPIADQPPEEPTAPARPAPDVVPMGTAGAALPAPTRDSIPPVEGIQAIIDSYGHRMATDAYDNLPLRMPRSGRLLVVLVVLAATAGIATLLVLGLRSDPRPTPTAKPQALTLPAVPGEPDLSPPPPPEPDPTAEAPAAPSEEPGTTDGLAPGDTTDAEPEAGKPPVAEEPEVDAVPAGTADAATVAPEEPPPAPKPKVTKKRKKRRRKKKFARKKRRRKRRSTRKRRRR